MIFSLLPERSEAPLVVVYCAAALLHLLEPLTLLEPEVNREAVVEEPCEEVMQNRSGGLFDTCVV